MRKVQLLIVCLILSYSSFVGSVQLVNISEEKLVDSNIRLVFELSTLVTYLMFIDNSSKKINILLKNTSKKKEKKDLPKNHHLIKSIEYLSQNKNDLQVILNLKVPTRVKSFLLKPISHHPYRLVIDIYAFSSLTEPHQLKNQKNSQFPISNSQFSIPNSQFPIPNSQLNHPKSQVKNPKSNKDIVIAIDAGHGGIDSGAIGVKGTMEKVLTLAIAKRLAEKVASAARMRAVLIRNGDYFVKLDKRIALARQYQADLLVSIHADAFPSNQSVQGSSVYILSQQGASSEAARWLAQKENAADLMGGVSLFDKENLLAQVLFDLSQTSTSEHSILLAQQVLTALGKVSPNHSLKVQYADFLVLRSPDIPSILVEVGFISNPYEEQNLKKPLVQQQLAEAIFEGISKYSASWH